MPPASVGEPATHNIHLIAAHTGEKRPLTKLVRPNIQDLTPYRCARDDYSDGVLLDANENSFGPALAAGQVSIDLSWGSLPLKPSMYPHILSYTPYGAMQKKEGATFISSGMLFASRGPSFGRTLRLSAQLTHTCACSQKYLPKKILRYFQDISHGYCRTSV